MNGERKLLIAFYGDDFTGSTDALEFLTRAGAKTVLFIEPPTSEQLSKYPDLDAFGVAGITRSLAPDEMEKVLRPAFQQIATLKPSHVHYKVCSTFDSSPDVGSIGKAMDVGASIFNNRFIPLVIGAPALGRYCVFGNLFARMGIGSDGVIYRLDRHPSMSKHPVTPSDESDLRLHLSKQTDKKTGLVDVLTLAKKGDVIKQAVEDLVRQEAEVILMDALEEEDLKAIGDLLAFEAGLQSCLFSVGSSAIEMALGHHWNALHILEPVINWPAISQTKPMLVLSGSCSPVSGKQIEWGLKNGFEELVLPVGEIKDLELNEELVNSFCIKALPILQDQKNLIIHTGGTSINQEKRTRNKSAELLGTILGRIGRKLVEETNLNRVVVAGGDTSSYAARAMGIESVEMITTLVPGAPLCRATAPESPLDGKEVNFKGGQVGAENYFGLLSEGIT
jgi:uncharacterized protein YgbK (DUF1537 family)